VAGAGSPLKPVSSSRYEIAHGAALAALEAGSRHDRHFPRDREKVGIDQVGRRHP
jgi:hypothetical protein